MEELFSFYCYECNGTKVDLLKTRGMLCSLRLKLPLSKI